MSKSLLYLAVVPAFLLLVSWKTPDYSRTCLYSYQRLNANAKAGLTALLGKKSLEDLTKNRSRAAKDSIERYAGPLSELHLSGTYKYKQLDSALRPLNLQILNGIARFDQQLSDQKLSNKDRLFALEVLIGLHTAMELPLPGITLPPVKSEMLQNDLFLNDERPKYKNLALITLRLHDAYLLGVRASQAGHDQQMIASFMESGYKAAGNWLAGSLNEAFAPKDAREQFEGPHWGEIIEPGKDPIYLFKAPPSFPGGQPYFYKFLNEHLRYPAQEWNKGIEGKCLVQFVVEKDGSLSHIQVVHPVTPNIDSEAVRVIRLSPKWLPGSLKIDGPPERSQWTCLLSFRIRPGQKREDAFNIPFRDNIKPSFTGGKAAFDQYIQANSTYTGPPYGRVTLHYMIDTSGRVKNAQVLRSLSEEADAQAVKLLKQSPLWKPGMMEETRKTMMGDTVSIWFRKK